MKFGLLYIVSLLSLFAGDNLGLHTYFGFHESFKSNHYCHICRGHKHFLNTAVLDDEKYLRTKSNFESDLKEFGHGIKSNTILHEIPNFHITNNLYCDPMHDMFEGICRYVIPKVLNILVEIEGHFSLKIFNFRMQFFDKRTRVIPKFTQDYFRRGFYICSASEMKMLLENLGLMIGDLVPTNNNAWDVYLFLRELHCSLLKSVITDAVAGALRESVANLKRKYQDTFNESLVCKLHLFLHYPRIVFRNGSVYAVCCMRLEAKHKPFEEYSYSCRSRKNICYSLMMKNQNSFAERLQARAGFQIRIKLGRSVETESCQLTHYEFFKNFISHDQLSVYQHIVSFVEINGTHYRTDMVLVLSERNNVMQFGKINYILVNEQRDIAFILSHLRTKSFIRHIHGFSVECSSDWSMVKYQDLYHYKPRNIHNLNYDDAMIMVIPC